MKNIIEELWNGERGPQDTLVNNNPHYKELQHLQSRNKTEMLESLSEEQKEKLEKYCDTTLEMNSVSEREAFASGFRIALRLAAEVFPFPPQATTAGSLQQTFTLHISHNSPDTIVLHPFQSNNDIPR